MGQHNLKYKHGNPRPLHFYGHTAMHSIVDQCQSCPCLVVSLSILENIFTSLGGLEPPTFRLTAERANRLRHRDGTCDDFDEHNLDNSMVLFAKMHSYCNFKTLAYFMGGVIIQTARVLANSRLAKFVHIRAK